jgi:hypothetical protein
VSRQFCKINTTFWKLYFQVLKCLKIQGILGKLNQNSRIVPTCGIDNTRNGTARGRIGSVEVKAGMRPQSLLAILDLAGKGKNCAERH